MRTHARYPVNALLIGLLMVLSISCQLVNPAAQVTPTTLIIAESTQTIPAETIPTQTIPSQPTQMSTATIYLIALEDKGQSGKLIGCDDSAIPVTVNIQPGDDPLKATLNALFAIDDQFYGESGLYNSLYQSDLAVEKLNLDAAGEATVWITGEYLLGGVCDNPRFAAQIEQTLLSFPGVTGVEVYLNDIPLEEVLSGK